LSLDLELAWQRLRWESSLRLRDLGEPMDWCFHSLHLRRFDFDLNPAQQGPGLDCSRHRDLRLRSYQCLSLTDYLDWNALLHRAQPGLYELFQVCEGECDFTLSLTPGNEVDWWRWPLVAAPYGQAPGANDRAQRQWLQRQLRSHRWWLRVDISHFFDSLDRRQLWARLRRCGVPAGSGQRLMELLQATARGPRGVANFGRISGLLARLQLQPLLQQLRQSGYRFALRTVDEFELFFQQRDPALQALEELRQGLERLGLRINYSQSWLVPCARALGDQRRQRWRAEYLWHRLASWLARRQLAPTALVQWLRRPLQSGAFLFRRPDYFELLAYPATQRAWLAELQNPHASPGDRLFLLLYLWESGQTPLPPLRGWLEQHAGGEDLLGRWCRACLEGGFAGS
jgi:hypothetical protein